MAFEKTDLSMNRQAILNRFYASFICDGILKNVKNTDFD